MASISEILSAVAAPMRAGNCLLCDQPSDGDGRIDLCRHCRAALPYNHSCCHRCALPLPARPETRMASKHLCGTCAQCPPPFSVTLAPLLYEGFPRIWVKRLKTRFGLVEGRLLGNLLAEAFLARRCGDPHNEIPLPQALVPVPLMPLRLARRGHNQTMAIARPLARRLDVPLHRLAVRRTRRTPAQRGLGRTARLSNLHDVFASRRWQGERVAIVDDVMTTGATASSLARALLEAGAAEVLVLCATRTATTAIRRNGPLLIDSAHDGSNNSAGLQPDLCPDH